MLSQSWRGDTFKYVSVVAQRVLGHCFVEDPPDCASGLAFMELGMGSQKKPDQSL